MRTVALALAFAFSGSPALALMDQSAPGITRESGQYVSAGAGQFGLSVASATGLTVPAGAVVALVCVEGGSVRYRDDGTAPTATVGIPLSGCMSYAGPLSAIQFISVGASSTIDALYYR